MKYQYKYCSNCGELFDKKSETFYLCPKCDFRIFVSPKPGVGALILNDRNELLATKRSYEPWKGKWGIPGGFINGGESAPIALSREIYEELSIHIEPSEFSYLGSFSGLYPYKGIEYQLVNTYYTLNIKGNINITLSDEATEYQYIKLDEINVNDFAGDIQNAVTELIRSKLR